MWEPDDRTSELRRLTSYISAITRQRTMVKNRIHSILHRNLISYGEYTDLFGRRGMEFLKSVVLPEDERFQLDGELRLLDYIGGEIGGIRERIAKKAVADEEMLRMMTLPGIDFLTALSLKAAIGDVRRFKSSKKLVSYIGLNPRVSQSGKYSYTGSITKRGRSHARWVLIQAAQHAVEAPSPLRAFFLRLKRKKGRNKAIVAVAAKLARIIWNMLTKKEDYFFAPPLRTKEKLRRLRVIATGERMKSGPKKGEKSRGGREKYEDDCRNDHNAGREAEKDYLLLVKNRLNSENDGLLEGKGEKRLH